MPAKGHALLSPSSAARWLTCTPSARLEEHIEDKGSDYAAEGTIAHAICEAVAKNWLCELSELEMEAEIDTHKKSPLYNPEMLDYAAGYARYILERIQGLTDPAVMLEKRLDISDYVPDCFGTGDCVIVGDGVLEIIDFKYGKGVTVDAKDNPQMMLYALGAIKALDSLYEFKTIRMTIYQPRVANGINSFELSKTKLLKWGKTIVIPQAKKAFAGEGDFEPSEKACKFCKAGAYCRARAERNMMEFEGRDGSDLISTEEAAELLQRSADIKAWLSSLEARVYSELLSGVDVKGWKLVPGRSIRKITDEEAVIKALRSAGIPDDEIFEKKLITLTAIEKLYGKKPTAELLADFIEKPEGKPTLVPEDDKREAINVSENLKNKFDE